MTSEEVSTLQIGDQVLFYNDAIGEVLSINPAERTISLHMLSGTETIISGPIPPDRQDVDTTCICLWGDLRNAEKTVATKALPRKPSVFAFE